MKFTPHPPPPPPHTHTTPVIVTYLGFLVIMGRRYFRPNKLVIIVKWSKIMQCNNQIKLITIPAIPRSTLCPVGDISNLLCLTPNGANLPLFQVKNAQNWVPLTDTFCQFLLGWIRLILASHCTLSRVQVPPFLLITM